MDEKVKRKRISKLRRYVRPHHDGYLMGGFMLALCLTVLVYTLIYDTDASVLAGCPVFGGLGAFFMYGSIKNTRKYRSKLEVIEKEGRLDALLDDFENGGRAFHGSLILGRSYIIGKRSGEIIGYGEISRIYQYIERDQLFENKRDLRIELKSGRRADVGKIPLHGKGSEEFEQAVSYICSVDPSINAGYLG